MNNNNNDLMVAYLTDPGCWLHCYEYASVEGKNLFLTPSQDWIQDCIWDWHPGLDPEVGSSLEYEYIVTHVAQKTAWYSPCVRRSLGGVNGRSLGGKVR